MNLKIFLLTMATFTVGLIELIIGGVLPSIAQDLNVSLSTAGQLITIYALIYAISGPTLLALTGKIERKRLYLWSMLIFTLGSFLAFWSPNYLVLFISRIITAASGSLIVTLSLTIAVKIVPKAFQARVIGIISMGVSSSIVLGVPLGVLAQDVLGWRALFLIIGLLTLVAMATIHLYLHKIPTEQLVPLRSQLQSLKNAKIISAHLVTTLALAGHYTLYAYFTPFLENLLNLDANWISVAYFVFGLSAVSGGLIGGFLADTVGATKSVLIIIAVFVLVMFILPFSTLNLYLFTFVLILWGALSWALSPAQQSYLIQNAPESSDIQQSFNFSALQIGIALGSALGGVVITKADSIESNAWVGGILMIAAFFCCLYSISRKPAFQTPENVN
ncbi:MFS transporter [Paenibacillus sp. IHBB 10380]|uniref:MFS transporter n=1 Tax=Paenibacillus sp. IHBB 10380 TaxID=1566358 RepID=UPI0005CFC3F8|nr:MFS transporter [Paenibacillus sp. IHBB 10380]AJS59566.1 major facilitator transporter [Paenibacillus sp. IHBB 10380]